MPRLLDSMSGIEFAIILDGADFSPPNIIVAPPRVIELRPTTPDNALPLASFLLILPFSATGCIAGSLESFAEGSFFVPLVGEGEGEGEGGGGGSGGCWWGG